MVCRQNSSITKRYMLYLRKKFEILTYSNQDRSSFSRKKEVRENIALIKSSWLQSGY